MRPVRTGHAITSMLLTACMALGPAASAHEPAPPIRYVVPYAPGGPTDRVAHLVAAELSVRLGTPVRVENRPGSNGSVGARLVARGPADGSVLLQGTSSTHGANPSLAKPGYDAVRDFQPITTLIEGPVYLSVRPDSPHRSVADLLAHARQRGGVRYATAGVGSPQHLAGELLRARTGIALQPMHFRGAAPALAALERGEVEFYFGSTGPADQRAGRSRVLAVSSPERWPLAPEVPTLMESGVPDFDVRGWFALFAPAATPAPVLQRLQSESRAALAQPRLRSALEGLGYRVVGGGPDELRERMAAELAHWAALVRSGQIQPE